MRRSEANSEIRFDGGDLIEQISESAAANFRLVYSPKAVRHFQRSLSASNSKVTTLGQIPIAIHVLT